jgi:hypothetical protein
LRCCCPAREDRHLLRGVVLLPEDALAVAAELALLLP